MTTQSKFETSNFKRDNQRGWANFDMKVHQGRLPRVAEFGLSASVLSQDGTPSKGLIQDMIRGIVSAGDAGHFGGPLPYVMAETNLAPKGWYNINYPDEGDADTGKQKTVMIDGTKVHGGPEISRKIMELAKEQGYVCDLGVGVSIDLTNPRVLLKLRSIGNFRQGSPGSGDQQSAGSSGPKQNRIKKQIPEFLDGSIHFEVGQKDSVQRVYIRGKDSNGTVVDFMSIPVKLPNANVKNDEFGVGISQYNETANGIKMKFNSQGNDDFQRLCSQVNALFEDLNANPGNYPDVMNALVPPAATTSKKPKKLNMKFNPLMNDGGVVTFKVDERTVITDKNGNQITGTDMDYTEDNVGRLSGMFRLNTQVTDVVCSLQSVYFEKVSSTVGVRWHLDAVRVGGIPDILIPSDEGSETPEEAHGGSEEAEEANVSGAEDE